MCRREQFSLCTVFENRLLGRIFGLTRGAVTRVCHMMLNDVLHNFFCLRYEVLMAVASRL